MVPAVCSTETTTEFHRLRSIGTVGSLNNSGMLLHCSTGGKNVHCGEVMSRLVDNPLRSSR